MSNVIDKEKMNIPFSPPDITEAEIAEVADALRSGWITTGLRTKMFTISPSRCTQHIRRLALTLRTIRTVISTMKMKSHYISILV